MEVVAAAPPSEVSGEFLRSGRLLRDPHGEGAAAYDVHVLRVVVPLSDEHLCVHVDEGGVTLGVLMRCVGGDGGIGGVGGDGGEGGKRWRRDGGSFAVATSGRSYGDEWSSCWRCMPAASLPGVATGVATGVTSLAANSRREANL